jgi:putative ABC transport system substrate-binding protein
MLEASTMRLSAVGLIVTCGLGLLLTPLVVAAQQPGKVYRIGVLVAGSPPPPSERDVLKQRLQELGWMEGQNIVVEYRWAEWQFERLPVLATELVQLKVDLILVRGGLEVLAAKQATRTIPIVIWASLDAVEQGFVASLAHPGGNVTGGDHHDLGSHNEATGTPEGDGAGKRSHGCPRV